MAATAAWGRRLGVSDVAQLRRTVADAPRLLALTRRAETLEISRYCGDAAKEVGQVEFLVGRVQVVVRQTEAHHHARNIQVAVEYSDNRNRASGPDVHSLLSKRFV